MPGPADRHDAQPTAEDTGPTRGELAALRVLLSRANPPGTWSAHPRDGYDWAAWCVNARSHHGDNTVTVIPEIGSDNANAIAAAMNWILPLIDRLAEAEGRGPGAAEDTGPPVDLRAVRDRAEVVAATVHGAGGLTRDDGCAACVLARRDVPALLAAVDDLSQARSHDATRMLRAETERDMLLLEMQRIAEGAEATAAEREMVLGEGGPLAYLAGVVVPGWRVIAAAVPVKLRTLRARREGR